MPRNTSGLRRGGSPGRTKGRRDSVPRSLKASVKRVFEDITVTDPKLIREAILKGLRGKPREAFPYVQLAAHYIDGKPAETVKLEGDRAMPTIINHFHTDGAEASET